MLKQIKKGLRIAIVFAILTTIMPQSFLPAPTQGAMVEYPMDCLSFQGNVGYFAQDGNVFQYDKGNNRTQEVQLPIADILSVVFDGTTLYLASQDMRIYAYDITHQSVRWTYEGFKDNKYSAMFLDQGILHIDTYTSEEHTIFQLLASDGTKLSSKTGYRDVKGALPYVSGEDVVFSSQDMALSKEGRINFVKLYDKKYQTSVYDATSKQIFAIGEDASLYAGSLPSDATYLTLYKTNQRFVGEQRKAMMVDNTPLLFMLEDQTLILYFYDGATFIKQNTNLSISTIANIAFDDGKVYVVDDKQHVQVANYTLPSKQAMDAQVAQLQNDILTLYDALSQNTASATLAHKEIIQALSTRYQAMTSTQQAQVLAYGVLSELLTKIASSQKVVDDMNTAISMLSSPMDFKKEDRQKALDINKTYLTLKDYDKTLIDEKLLQLLEKIQAFDVEDEIAALPSYGEIAIKDLARVQEIAQHYDALNQAWKSDVGNYATLLRLENRIYELMGEHRLGDAYWANFGGNKTSSATTNTKTPYTAMDVETNFKAEGTYQESIIVDNHIYTIRDKQYLTILDNKGNKIAETKLYSTIGFFSRLAYGDGKIYVALNDRIQAFDAKTLRPLWLSQTGNQFISTITYHNGYIYSGMTTGGGGDKGKTNGYFFAIKVQDEDINSAYEVKDFTWTCGEEKNTGYYWAGAAIVGDAVIFAGDQGEVISHHLTQDIIFDRYYLGDSKVRANVTYIEDEKAILVGTQDTHTLFKIEVRDDGSFQKQSIQRVDVGGEITGGIAYYNGRAYVPSGGMYAKGFSVVDTSSMQVAYRNNEIGSQSYPLISTAYATAENNQTVQVYVLDYKTGDLRVLSDAQRQTVSKMETLAKGYGTYNSGSITPDAYGNLYLCGASFSGGGPLYSLRSNDAKFSVTDIEQAIANLPKQVIYQDKKAFQLLLGRYLSLSEEEQKLVRNADALFQYEQEMLLVSDAKLQRIQQIIDALPAEITLLQQADITTAWKEYGTLLESDQLRIDKYDTLLRANEQLQVLLQGVEQLRSDIDAISFDDLQLSDQVLINTLCSRYDNLSEQEQAYITNYDKLLQAKRILQRLSDELELPNLQAQIQNIMQQDSLSLANEKEVMSLYKRIMMMDEEVRGQLLGYHDFLDVYQAIVEQRKLVDDIDEAIWKEIQPLDIQLADRAAILDIYQRYTLLSPANQAYVLYSEDLEYAKIVIDKMEKGYIAQELFEKIKMANTTYSFETTTSDGLFLEYTFKGNDVRKPYDFAYSLSTTSIHEGAIQSIAKHAQILSFAHEGSFPGKVTIKMNTTLEDGTYTLYAYHPITRMAEFVDDIVVANAMTDFTLTHASTYFISKQRIDPLKPAQFLTSKDVATGDTHSTWYLWVAIGLSLCSIICFKKKCSR